MLLANALLEGLEGFVLQKSPLSRLCASEASAQATQMNVISKRSAGSPSGACPHQTTPVNAYT